MRQALKQAFLAVRKGYSADRVVADPELNQQYISMCNVLGAAAPPRDLNKGLLNLRKGGLLKGLGRSKRTSFPDEEDYRFASEIAARFLEQRYGGSLDDIICDPDLVTEFDTIAAGIAPGFHSLQYRWAALGLRKSKRLKPEILSRVIPAEAIELGSITEIDVAKIPISQGIYIFYGPTQTLYVGESSNLRNRIEKHLDHSDNKGLARWLWDHGSSTVRLEVRTLPESTTTRVRKAVEAELIASRRPLFNVQR